MASKSGITGYQCDSCPRFFGAYTRVYIIDGIYICPICFRKEFTKEQRREITHEIFVRKYNKVIEETNKEKMKSGNKARV